MDWLTGLAVYFVIWWVSLFMVLPLGVKRHTSDVAGADPGAPEKPDLLKKMLINTVVAGILFAILYAVIEGNLVSLQPLE